MKVFADCDICHVCYERMCCVKISSLNTIYYISIIYFSDSTKSCNNNESKYSNVIKSLTFII